MSRMINIMELSLNSVTIGLALLGVFLLRKLLKFGMRPKDYPPGNHLRTYIGQNVEEELREITEIEGPPTFPIIGNLLQMAMVKPGTLHLVFSEWGKKYGPIFSLKIGAMTIIVLNKDQPVKDLLDKRSNIYSVRMDNLLRKFGDGLMLALRDNDEIWRRQRKMYHLLLNGNVADKYLPYQSFETTQLLYDFLERPNDAHTLMHRYTTSLASTIAYAWRTTSIDQPEVKTMNHWIKGWTVIGAQTQITEWFPFIRTIYWYMPTWLSSSKKEIWRLIGIEKDLWMRLLNKAKQNLREGNKRPCFAVEMLLSNEKIDSKEDALTDLQTAFNAGHAFAAASDTTFNTLLAFVKAMILYPDVQAKAHEEIDRVIGPNRMPEWKDRADLPYVRSIVKETLRWLPTTVTGVPHSVSRDDEYMGYKIPKRSVIFFNTWAINNDPARVLNPRRFDPSRFLNDTTGSMESASNHDPAKRDHFSFGAGRRICPGIHIADRSLFVAISRMLWGYRIEQGRDEEGRFIPLDADVMNPGFVAEPEAYSSHFVPRTPHIEKMIREEWTEARTLLDEQGNYSEKFYEEVFGTSAKDSVDLSK